MFVRWSCDCVGLLLAPEQAQETRCFVFKPCDIREGSPFNLSGRKSCDDKEHRPLSADEVATLLLDIDRLAADGDRFRTIKALLA